MTFQLEVRGRELADALGRLGEVTPGNSTLPILNNVLLSCAGGRVELQATNLDQALALTIPGDGVGALTTELRQLTAIAARLDGDDAITLATAGEHLAVKQRRSSFKLPVLPAADFPSPMAEAIDAEPWTVPGPALASALRMLEPACANDARPHLHGARFDAAEDQMLLVATDGHRLARYRFESAAPAGFAEISLPHPAMRAALALAKRAEQVQLRASPSALTFEDGSRARLRTRVLAETYPDWRRVVPQGAPLRVRVKTAALQVCAGRVAVIRSDTVEGKSKIQVIRLEMQAEEIVASTRGAAGAEAVDACPCATEGDPGMAIELNSDYLAWALASLEDVAEVELGLEGPIAPMTVTPAGSGAAQRMCLLMPRRPSQG